MERYREQHEPCEVVRKAAILASEKGLDQTIVRCPFQWSCQGVQCVWDTVRFKTFKRKGNVVPVNELMGK